MATPPEDVRYGLTLVTSAAMAEVADAATAGANPAAVRGILFDAVPLIVGSFADGSSALALDWYEELREEADPPERFTPSPVALIRDDHLATTVAWSTEALRDLSADFERAIAESMARLLPEIQKEVAQAFWDTVTENVADDPAAEGWLRFARPGACALCRMLADKGAVYKADTARFAAHTNCHCVAAPVFDGQPGEEASVEQYVASKRRRTDREREALREYLKKNYGA